MSWDANHRRKESNKATDPLGLDRVNGVRFSLAGALWILSEIFFWLWSRTSADWMDCLLWWLTVGWIGTEGLGARLVLVGGGCGSVYPVLLSMGLSGPLRDDSFCRKVVTAVEWR